MILLQYKTFILEVLSTAAEITTMLVVIYLAVKLK